ncbi:MAG: ATP-binding protein, partial [Actinomycetota bacterium]
MDPLRIHLFGGFLLERGQATLPPIASRTGRSLFAYLVMHSDRPQQRDYLAGRFWPHLPEGRARRRLSHTLWQIQDVVNTGSTSYLDATTDTLAFDRSAPFWLDVAEFDASFEASPGDSPHGRGHQAAALRRCVELYRGDFLAGYFDDWVLIEQDHYRQRYLTALRRLVDTTKSDGSYEEALAFARRLTHHDPLSEEAHQEVMRLSFLLGRISEALDQYERCRSVLEEEMGAEPSAPTVELYEKIMRQRQSGVRPLREDERTVLLGRRSDAPFVGREQERRAMVDSFERVLAGAGGVVLVEGEPGVGKTRTTVEAAEDARWRGFDVTWGMCRPGALRPYAPIIEVLDSLSPLRVEQLSERVSPVWLGEVAKLVPSLARAVDAEPSAQLRPAEESARTIEALVHTLAALGKIAPHVIVVDDVHWADEDTLSVLSQVGTRLAESRVLLMLLYRSEEARGDAEVWDVLRDLDRTAGLGRVVLSPLSVFELDDMVRKVLGTTRLESAVATRLHRQTGGNVLFTLETLLALRDRGLFESETDPGTVLSEQLADSDIPIAPRVRSVIESRLSMLGDEAATVYQIAAIAGDLIDLNLIESVTRFPRSMVLMAVDELMDRGLFADDGDGLYRITHDQVRQVIYEHLEPEGRRNLHMQIARHLADSNPDDVEVIGHHFRQGGDPAKAASYLKRAGLRAIELNAFSTARTHLRSAWEMAEQAGTGDVELYTLLGSLEDVLSVLGRREEQSDVIEEMRRLSADLPALHGDVERRRAWLLAQIGELHEAEASATRSVEIERESSDTEGLSASLVALGTIRLWSGRPLDAIPPLTEAVESASDESPRADAMTELASALVEVRDLEAALSHLANAGQIYGDVGDLRGQAEVFGIEARVLRSTGDRDKAVHKYERAIDLCRRIGYRHGEGVNLTNLSNLHQLLGEVARSLNGYDEAARIFAELGNKRGEAMVLANSASARHSLLGEDDRARADANSAMRLFSDMGDRARKAQCEATIAG